MSESRKDVLVKAMEAEISGEAAAFDSIFTDDVVGWSPLMAVSGLTGLSALAAVHDMAFSNVAILFRGLDEVGNKAFAEWVIEADHTGPFLLDKEVAVEATGRRVQLAGVTVADFRDGKIRSFRTYFDDLSLFEQIIGA